MVFLPGQDDIEYCLERLIEQQQHGDHKEDSKNTRGKRSYHRPLSSYSSLHPMPFYGSLPVHVQEAVFEPLPGAIIISFIYKSIYIYIYIYLYRYIGYLKRDDISFYVSFLVPASAEMCTVTICITNGFCAFIYDEEWCVSYIYIYIYIYISRICVLASIGAPVAPTHTYIYIHISSWTVMMQCAIIHQG